MTNTTYNGEPIDLSWQTAPWNDPDGETITKGTEHNGEINMTELPSEVNADELTDLQETIIRTAVRNPELSTSQIDEIADCGKHYSSNVLAEKVPDWYENAFKKMGKSTDTTRNDRKDDYKSSAEVLAEETGEPQEKFEVDDDMDIPELDDLDEAEYPHPDELESVAEKTPGQYEHTKGMASEESIQYPWSDSTNWKPYALVALVGFVLGLLWGGRNE